MNLPRLNQKLLNSNHAFPADLERPNYDARDLPVKVLQIGEGVFMRGFVNWIIHRLNQKKLFNGSVVVCQPRAGGHARKLNEQDGLFTLILRGQSGGKLVQSREIVGGIREGIDPYMQYEKLMQQARNPDLRFVFSNTTEAGIAISDADRAEDQPPASFPAKLTAVLRERFNHFHADPQRGLIFIPCELIERNGDALKKCVLDTAKKWNLGAKFEEWVNSACVFANTLVDRIVTGFPTAEAAEIQSSLGYEDTHLNTAEPYHAWIIEAPASVQNELPLSQLGLNITWTKDVTPYRERKVRLLNGAHTMLTPVGLLAGYETVKQAIDDPKIAAFIKRGLFEEIIPTIDQPRAELEQFANDVLERFANPFIQHKLSAIAMNSVSKFKARLLPAMVEWTHSEGTAPASICASLGALLMLYQTSTTVQDDATSVNLIKSAVSSESLTRTDGLWPIPEQMRPAIVSVVDQFASAIRKYGTVF